MTLSVPDAIRDRVYAYLRTAGVELARGSSDGVVRQK